MRSNKENSMNDAQNTSKRCQWLIKSVSAYVEEEMEKGDRPPGWQSIISINSFIELIASGSECSRNEASAASPHFFPPFFYTFFLFEIVLIFLDFLFYFSQ